MNDKPDLLNMSDQDLEQFYHRLKPAERLQLVKHLIHVIRKDCQLVAKIAVESRQPVAIDHGGRRVN